MYPALFVDNLQLEWKAIRCVSLTEESLRPWAWAADCQVQRNYEKVLAQAGLRRCHIHLSIVFWREREKNKKNQLMAALIDTNGLRSSLNWVSNFQLCSFCFSECCRSLKPAHSSNTHIRRFAGFCSGTPALDLGPETLHISFNKDVMFVNGINHTNGGCHRSN